MDWHGKAGQAWRGMARTGTVRQARHGKARQGEARQARSNKRHAVSRSNHRKHSGVIEMNAKTQTAVVIKPANLQTAEFRIVGTAPLVQARFSKKGELMAKMAEGATAKNKRERKARDYEHEMREAMHVSEQGWQGLPASAFRAAMISACRLVGFKMTLAKLSVFVEHDGIDALDGLPLIQFEGTPELSTMHTRNATGVADVRARPMWREWSANVRVRFDADQFSIQDVTNLMQRVGMQVGIGEGRPDSRSSAGLGWGTFRLA
jgi:hypothetical protein